MNKIKIIFNREFRNYFNSPIAYIFIAVFLIVSMFLFFPSFFLVGQASVRNYFTLMPWMFLFLAPAITMRLWAEEKQSGTMEVLLTLPVKDEEVVLGKFLSALAFLGITVLLSLTLPISVAFLGNLDWGPVIGGYLGTILMGGAYLSIGMFLSSITKNQIVAFLLAIVGCFVMYIIGDNMVINSVLDWLAPILRFFGVSFHYYNVSRGVIDLRDVIYYFSFIGFFLYLNVRVLGRRFVK